VRLHRVVEFDRLAVAAGHGDLGGKRVVNPGDPLGQHVHDRWSVELLVAVACAMSSSNEATGDPAS
jgi:hypothetical protein